MSYSTLDQHLEMDDMPRNLPCLLELASAEVLILVIKLLEDYGQFNLQRTNFSLKQSLLQHFGIFPILK